MSSVYFIPIPESTVLKMALFGGVTTRRKKGMLQVCQLKQTPSFHADGHKCPVDDGYSQIQVAAILSLDFAFKIQIISLPWKKCQLYCSSLYTKLLACFPNFGSHLTNNVNLLIAKKSVASPESNFLIK